MAGDWGMAGTWRTHCRAAIILRIGNELEVNSVCFIPPHFFFPL
jgi:hypothetical protein